MEQRLHFYAKKEKGNVAKPLRMALSALIIQTKFQYSDRELVKQITENPYLQYFIGLPGYQETPPFDASMLMEANEYLLQEKKPDKKMVMTITTCLLIRVVKS